MRSLFAIVVASLGLMAGAAAVPQDGLFNDGWEFRREGEDAWRTVTLPHDWGVEGGFLTNACPRQGDLPYVGTGYYRRRFPYDPSAYAVRPAKVLLEIEGAMCESVVTLNGRTVGERPYGYATYRADLTDALAADNELVVKVVNLPRASRWYPGSGLYRNVRMLILPAQHMIPDTLSIRSSEVTERSAKVTVDFDWTGGHSNFTFVVDRPRLWSPETPELYEIELFGRRYRYGIREARFDPEKGFFLNGRHRQMRGVCLHHDLGPVGAAFVADVARRQLTLLKEIGCDAIRTSHNPPAPGLLDLCDELGLMVMDEAFDMWEEGKTRNDYARHFREWHERDLADLVRRDRNHPSVVMWSIGNEVSEQWGDKVKDGIRIGKELTAIVHREDPTRPVTFGNNSDKAMDDGLGDVGDVFGANYLPQHYAKYLAEHKGRGIVGTETCSTVSSRGEYFLPFGEAGQVRDRKGALQGNQVSSYDLWWMHSNDCLPETEFAAQEANPAVYGEFVWTGFDYLGEPDPCSGPARSSYFGIFDLAGFRKDRAYCYQAHWRPETPMAHLLPHWNWPGREGQVVPVHVYTSGDEAELFVNGVSQGRQRKGANQHRLRWDKVVYQPGELRVVAYRDGRRWAEDMVRTSGAAVRVEREERRFGEHVFVTLRAVDAHGVFVPTAKERLNFTVADGTELVSLCNGDPTDRDPFRGRTMRLFNGLCLAIVRGDAAGLKADLAAPLGVVRTPAYRALQERLCRGWNTWQNDSMTEQVRLPEGFAVSFGLKPEDGAYVRDFLKRSDYAKRPERVVPGLRADDGSYTSIGLAYGGIRLRLETAVDGEDLVALVTPEDGSRGRLVVSARMAFGLPGTVARADDALALAAADRTLTVAATAPVVPVVGLDLRDPYLAFDLSGKVGVFTGRTRTLAEVEQAIAVRRAEQERRVRAFGEKGEPFQAMQTILAWNTIYDASGRRAITPVSRAWNKGWGGYVLFDWDTYFASLMLSSFNHDLACANAVEITKAITPDGFIPNYKAPGRSSWDRSQPPVGGLVVRELHRRYGERWLLEETYDELLSWNRWWPRNRDIDGYLAWGSRCVRDGKVVTSGLQGAKFESGLDNSPMYDDVPMHPERQVMLLADVGLMGMYVADCKALADIARELGREDDRRELLARAERYGAKLATLWDEKSGIYRNRRLDTGAFSDALSPCNFYPMLAGVCTQEQAQRMVREHYFNQEEFHGRYVLPSIARNCRGFADNDYWRGRIWAPMNLLVYLGLRNYDLAEARADLVRRSRDLLMENWRRTGGIFENYNSVTGAGDDVPNADGFYHWGALLTYLGFLEER